MLWSISQPGLITTVFVYKTKGREKNILLSEQSSEASACFTLGDMQFLLGFFALADCNQIAQLHSKNFRDSISKC